MSRPQLSADALRTKRGRAVAINTRWLEHHAAALQQGSGAKSAAGMATRQTAAALGISPETVRRALRDAQAERQRRAVWTVGPDASVTALERRVAGMIGPDGQCLLDDITQMDTPAYEALLRLLERLLTQSARVPQLEARIRQLETRLAGREAEKLAAGISRSRNPARGRGLSDREMEKRH